MGYLIRIPITAMLLPPGLLLGCANEGPRAERVGMISLGPACNDHVDCPIDDN